MISLLAIIPVAFAAFVATNLDNLTLLVTLLARYRRDRFMVLCGYFACMTLLVLIAYWIGRAAGFLPVDYIGLLGIIPLTVGTVGIWHLLAGKDGQLQEDARITHAGKTVFVVTLLTQFGNGADTIITLGALFADSNPAADSLIVFTLATAAVLFAGAALYAISHPALKVWVDRNAARVTPFILIAVGAYILFNTATDLVPD